MLYLYSGIDGKGAAIKFKPTVMSELLRSFFNKTMVYTLDDRGLKLGVDYELKYGWVYYQNRSAKSRVKYKGD